MSNISKLAMLGAAGAGGDAYFINFIYSATGGWNIYPIETLRQGIVENSNGTIAAQNILSANNNSRVLLTMLNPSGEVTQSLQLDESPSGTQDTAPFGIVSEGGFFYNTIYHKDTSGKIHSVLLKINEAGTVSWQVIEEASGGGHVPYCSAVSGTNLIQAGGTRNSGGSFDNGYISQYTNSGTRSFVKTFKNGSTDWQVIAVDADSSGNIFTGSQGYSWTGGVNVGGESQYSLDKFNSSGTHTAQITFGAAYGDPAKGVKVDSSGNVYAMWRSQGGGGFNSGHYLAKFDNSLSLQWTRYFDSSAWVNDITIDSNGDIIATIYDGTAIFVKIDSSGSIVFQRELRAFNGAKNLRALSINTTANDDIIFSGDTNVYGNNGVHVTKVRGDGSGLGTFGNYVYQNYTGISLSNITLSVGNNGFTTVSPSISVVSSPSVASSTAPQVQYTSPVQI
jgi:hypothetical protein